jgi:hypothetical protein
VSSNVHTALSRNDWPLDLVYDLPSQSLQGDPSIDDPVNDTGLGPRCGVHPEPRWIDVSVGTRH